jgi:predicted choloylglycine hydrolase
MSECKSEIKRRGILKIIKQHIIPEIYDGFKYARMLFALHRIRYGVINNENIKDIRNDVIMSLLDSKYGIHIEADIVKQPDPKDLYENVIKLLTDMLRSQLMLVDEIK